MYLVTGATGQLGRLAIQSLLASVPAARIVAAVRNPARAADLAALGVQVRQADYDQPAGWDAALAGVERVLLVSSSEIGRRVAQHGHVIDAAARAGVQLLAYTSLLHADRSPLGLATEHQATEALLAASGVPHVRLRHGWYTENYLGRVKAAVQSGRLAGCAGEGRIAPAARADYAAAAAAVLTLEDQAGRIHELAGDDAFTLGELAAHLSRTTGRSVVYEDMPEAAYQAALEATGLPPAVARLLADSDAGAARGALFDDSRQLSRLAGRPTTPWTEMVRRALAA